MKVDKDKIKKFFGMNGNQQLPIRQTVQIKNEIIVPPVELVQEEKKSEPKPRSRKVERLDHKKEFIKLFNKLIYTHNSYEVWNDFVIMSACSISNAVDKIHCDEREKLYLSRMNKYKKIEERQTFGDMLTEVVLALEDNPEQDFLGAVFMELGLGNKSNGQFFTPYHVSKFMAAITLFDMYDDINEKGYATIHDSCCGAGVMLIAAINEAKEQLGKENINFQNHILVTGQDIDQTAALMCYIQISLLGVAGFVKIGDALTDPMSSTDTTENYWFTPMYFSNIWVYRRMFKKIDEMTKGENKDEL